MSVEPDNEKKKQRWQIAILVALLLATAGVATYQVMRTDPSKITPVTRTLSDFPVTWRCLKCGNTQKEPGGQGPRECPKCKQKQVYVSITWSCPTHGLQPVAYQHDAEENPTKVKVGDKDWVPAITADGFNIHCPVCNAPMLPPGGP